jgi:hypothetical protein
MRWSFWQIAKTVGSSGSKHSGRDKEHASDLHNSHQFDYLSPHRRIWPGVSPSVPAEKNTFLNDSNVSKFVSKSVVGGRSYTSPEAILGRMRAFSSGENS